MVIGQHRNKKNLQEEGPNSAADRAPRISRHFYRSLGDDCRDEDAVIY